MSFKEKVSAWFKELQAEICAGLEKADGKSSFSVEPWEREGGGGGITRVIKNGNVFEKGGVNFSAVQGEMPDKILAALKLEKSEFYATGVSIVIHPYSPKQPTIHMNVRYFEMKNGVAWFGGGIDLTPYYVDKKQAGFFHHVVKNACDAHDSSYYPKFKTWADEYFYIKHREETRGVGGIFFDHLKANSPEGWEKLFAFVQSVGRTFLASYIPIIEENKKLSFTPEEKKWQLIRRGRYVEFNLIYDKGTKFGLDTNGRTESILMSLPAEVNWEYSHTPEEGSKEADTQALLKKDIDWLSFYQQKEAALAN